MFRGIGLFLVGCNVLAQNATPSAEQLFERLSPSIWVVKTFDDAGRPIASGSAVVIRAGSLITNCHVLAKARKVSVTRDNVAYGASLEHADTARDLCQLKVANFNAPPVTIASTGTPKIGARVYAIGNPRGLEMTISDGLLSGIRRADNDEFVALQITVPISPGSSGGGLFDAQGRLIGITTFILRDAQNLNFAVPAAWIAEVPARSAAALAARSERSKPAAATQAGNAQVFEYRLRDRTTGLTQNIRYRLDRMDGDQLIFNQGSRVERAGGEVVTLTNAIAGEYELAMPPGGWITKTPERGQTWQLQYETKMQNQRIGMSVTARAADESTMRIGEREFRIMRVEFTGFTERGTFLKTNAVYAANAWYAPELGRIVRFDAKTRGGSGTSFFLVDEALELFDIRKE
ncbi:S1C family serine protease [Polaromonas sp. JS666]|uniref:S1C family serine protease n=1 Tax=Polaromonas sp. (strain JS666 / ATCC BAA-500) TaxID=296591 RepID=UPI0008900733|nr:serine protease [Polaromonas sp. JS666]SDN85228.1 Trypsin-like peptidase domain-containing protein [Polaromonas sp. JS666]